MNGIAYDNDHLSVMQVIQDINSVHPGHYDPHYDPQNLISSLLENLRRKLCQVSIQKIDVAKYSDWQLSSVQFSKHVATQCFNAH